jgi:hypothetical protein
MLVQHQAIKAEKKKAVKLSFSNDDETEQINLSIKQSIN